MIASLLLIELILLYILSRQVTQRLFEWFLLIFRARSIAISFVLALTFPGTVVHELAHLFTAEVLRVPTGKMTLVPESIRETDIKAGSVMIAESDPFRRYAIGLAPIFWGLISLTALSFLLSNPDVFGPSLPKFSIFNFQFSIVSVICFYFLFAVSNTMFSSKKDLEGFLPFAIVIAIFSVAFYFLGIRFTLTGQALEITNRIVITLTKSLGVVLGVNIAILLITKLLTTLLTRVLHVRMVYK